VTFNYFNLTESSTLTTKVTNDRLSVLSGQNHGYLRSCRALQPLTIIKLFSSVTEAHVHNQPVESLPNNQMAQRVIYAHLFLPH